MGKSGYSVEDRWNELLNYSQRCCWQEIDINIGFDRNSMTGS